MNNQRIVVTGGAGFIGSHLCEALVEQGNEVVVIDTLLRGNKIPKHIFKEVEKNVLWNLVTSKQSIYNKGMRLLL